MLTNNINHKFPNFKNLIFNINNCLVAQVMLSTDFNFFFLLNQFYSYQLRFLLKKFNKFYLKTFSIHWVRVCFKGKGYRLRKFKNNGKITLNFGHSHWAKLMISQNYFFKKFRRQNYICLLNNYYRLKVFKFYIKFIKKLNSYTKRGLRLKKQYIQKRFGKISQVVSSLH